MAELAFPTFMSLLDDNGAPLSGGELHTYESGTTTPKATYKDVAGVEPNTNPIILDSAGRAPFDVRLVSGSYKFILKDFNKVTVKTIDPYQSFADMISTGGSLAVLNNLSDLDDVPTALVNLGISPLGPQTEHAVTDGQAATNLTGLFFDGVPYSSVVMEVEIIRGTTVFSNIKVVMQYLNGTWRVITGPSLSNEKHGVTFSVSQVTTVGQLKAALNSGAGDGTIKVKIHSFTT